MIAAKRNKEAIIIIEQNKYAKKKIEDAIMIA